MIEPYGARGRGVVVVLVVVNVLVHVTWLMWARESVVGLAFMSDHFLVSMDAIAAGRFWTLVTSALSHVSTGHLLFNMLALGAFGSDVAAVIGTWRFLQLYFVGAVVASLGHLLYQVMSGSDVPALGASGAVMAIAVVFAGFFPTRTLLVNFFIPIPAALAVLAYVALDLLGTIAPSTDGVAHAAHLGGAVYGLLCWMVWRRRI